MDIRIITDKGTIINLPIDEINRQIKRGKLTGDEMAWMPGYGDWVWLRKIDGVKQLKGPHGWLLFFVLINTVLMPLWFGRMLYATWKYADMGFFTDPDIKVAAFLEHGWIGFITLAGFVTSIMLWRGDIRGKHIAQLYLGLRLVGSIACFLSVRYIITISNLDVVHRINAAEMGQMTRELIYCLAWWLYFKKSIRVRNTFTSTESINRES